MNLVQLLDGRMVPSDSEDWRHLCEARTVLAMPTKAARNAYLWGVFNHDTHRWERKGVAQLRGEAEAKRLEATIWQIWDAQRKTA